MLHIHFANRCETLIDLLLARLGGVRSDPYVAEQVIVPSEAMRRALTLAVADRHGICANVEFQFLAQWLWQWIGHCSPALPQPWPYTPALLTWRVHAAFGDAGFVAAHPRLQTYLRQADEVMRYELARRIASLLDQTLTYRPDWVERWLQGETAVRGGGADPTASTDERWQAAQADERWQAALWRRIAAELGSDPLRPVAVFVDALERGWSADGATPALPATVHVFALPTMSPLHLRLLAQLGRRIELHLYVINPCAEYWLEVVDRRRLSHLAARGRDQAHEVGNRLLAAWGRQTQSHLDALLEGTGDAADDDACFVRDPAGTLLARIHNAVLDLAEIEPGTVVLDADDRSIELHVCHSRTRELEVLHDHLLGLFAADPGLRPSDILVVTPDLDAAAPLVDAVFGTVSPDRLIPYTLTGRARTQVNLPAAALLALLALLASRCPASEVFALLQTGGVARRFGLDDDGLRQVHAWIRASGFRWALDADHRAGFGVPATERHTLADGMDRLFLGYALPTQAPEPFAGLLGAGDAEGSDATALGAFWRFADALAELRAAAAVPQPPAAWQALLERALADSVAAADDELEDLRELQQAIAELVETMQQGGLVELVPLAVVRAALAQALDDPARGGVPTGHVTFSSMSSLRGLPYAVVCAIGLDDGAFPGSQRPSEFDLMALHPRRGDRQRRIDERNLFLDLLLAARRSLYLSHTGRSVRDNAPLPPSVLVADLLDVLVPAIADDPRSAGSLARARARLVVEHPLQPFSIAAFVVDGDPRLRSFHRELGEALRQSLAAPAPASASCPSDGSVPLDDDADEDQAVIEALPAFFVAALPEPEPAWREVSLAQLIEFFRNPCRYLLRRRLGIELRHEDGELHDEEPFVPDRRARAALARRLLPALLAGAGSDDVHRLALAGTEMPAGALGRRQLDHELQALAGFASRLRAATADECVAAQQVAVAIDLDGQAWRVQAGFADLRPSGLLRWRYDEIRAGDRIEAWLSHLMACASPAASGQRLRTRWLSREGGFGLRTVDDPRPVLADLLALYRRGLRAPLHFYPWSAWQFIGHGGDLAKADAAWRARTPGGRGEGDEAAYRLALRGHPDPLDDEFVTCAQAVYAPLLEHLEDEQP